MIEMKVKSKKAKVKNRIAKYLSCNLFTFFPTIKSLTFYSQLSTLNLKHSTLHLTPYTIYLLSLFLLLPFKNLHAQYFPSKNYPTNYFSNPLGIPMQLSGNFGELRREHFHMGIDLRTNQKENLPVYAAASGYVSRIKIERFGYGRAIYITHENGYTTIYAHLNNFYDTLHSYVLKKQYAEEQWEQDFVLTPNQFPVSKGQLIALSGNTGGSQGAHLHFEIRDEKGNNINPLLFNFNIEDTKPPIIDHLYYYDRNFSTYSIKPIEITIQKAKAGLRVKDSVIYVNSNKISLGVIARDVTNTSPFKFGIYQAEVWVDSAMAFAFRLNDFSYDDSRYINACTDYVTHYTSGRNIQHLSKLPGNQLNIFSTNTSDGIIELNDTLPKQIELIIKDVAGNYSTINFIIQKNESVENAPIVVPTADELLLPNIAGSYNQNNLQLEFNEAAFYDTLPLHITYATHPIKSMALSNQYTFNPQMPVHNDYQVGLSLIQEVADSIKKKIVMVLKNKTSKHAQLPIWKDNTATATFNKLGFVELLVDTIPPTIQPIAWKNNFTFRSQTQLIIQAKDAIGEIKNFRAELNGNWLMFRRKGDLFIYDFDDCCPLGEYELKIIVTDEAENISEKIFSFARALPVVNKSKKKTLVKKKVRLKKKKR
jgi:hypothetical protein